MKQINNLSLYPAGQPLPADELVEFHAARIILLVSLCGISNRVDGLTKLAKLDFFTRYPEFFEKASHHLNHNLNVSNATVESAMIRHHYGPWDKRYYHVLAYLEAKNLLEIKNKGNSYQFVLTDNGKNVAKELEHKVEFESLKSHMKKIKKVFGAKSGNYLKKLIYDIFNEEVAVKSLGEVIE